MHSRKVDLLVQQVPNPAGIYLTEDPRLAKLPLFVPRLMAQQMSPAGLAVLDLAPGRYFESLFRALVGLLLWHGAWPWSFERKLSPNRAL